MASTARKRKGGTSKGTPVEHVVLSEALNVRSSASGSAPAIGTLYRGDKVSPLAEEDGWMKITWTESEGIDSSATGTDTEHWIKMASDQDERLFVTS